MAKVKVAVLGTGSLGQHHARIYAELQAAGLVELTGIFDTHADTARTIAGKHKLRVFASIAEAAAASDALNIVTPTTTHFEIARTLLAQGKHVLVEKPMTDNSEQAAELCELAQRKNCVLQVGHVERFNPVFKFLESVATEPKFIECHRLSPYPARSTDIGVVLDLMIHDLDVVLAFVKAPVTSVDAVGIPVLSRSEDIANARLRFANGCIANLTASRISPERMRKIRVFSGPGNPCYISLDYRAQEGYLCRIAREGEAETPLLKKILAAKLGVGKDSAIVSEFAGKKIVREPVPLAKEEPLKLELQSFVACVREKQTPVVSGKSAKRALDLAFEITGRIQNNLNPPKWRTFLFTWNPHRWEWEKLADEAARTIAGEVVNGGWTCGNRKDIAPRERMFLVRLSENPRGIIGSGWVIRKSYRSRHWDQAKAKAGKKCWRVDGEWDRLINPLVEEPLGLDRLQKGRLEAFDWTPRSSGICIPEEIASELEQMWAAHIGRPSLATTTTDLELAALEGADRLALVRHRKREQALREAKIAETRKLGIGRPSYEVPHCGFDFEAVYGELGKRYAQVHHLKPLSDRTIPSKTKLSDLAIVCANCHAMIHRGGKCRPLGSLIHEK